MKITKIFSGIMALVMGAAVLTACSDSDDYFAATTPLLTDGAVVTGSSDVTATTATIYGTVTGLDKLNTASYATGFYYGFSADALTETLAAASASEFSGSLSGLAENQTIYYQAYVTLQGKLTYKGEVKSLVTTDATVTTGSASGVDFAQATLAGTASKYPSDSKVGIMVAATSNQEAVRAGLTFARVSERRVAEIVGQTGSRYDGTNFENVSVGKFWLLFYQGMRHIITQTSSHTCHFERMGQSVVHKYAAWQRKHLRLVL